MLKEVKYILNTVFSDLKFDNQRHLYFVNNINYPSVSSKVEKHAPKFDAEKRLPLSAKKEGVTIDELRRKWQTTNKDACDLGHEVHEFLENFTGIETPKLPQEKAGIQFFLDISKEYEIISREVKMYSRLYKYAGTADLLLYHKPTKKIILADYKTNKDLFKFHNEYLHNPFQYLECTPYNKYQLQLSYYQIMLEEVGIKISDRMLVYLKIDGTYTIFNTYDFTKQLQELIA